MRRRFKTDDDVDVLVVRTETGEQTLYESIVDSIDLTLEAANWDVHVLAYGPEGQFADDTLNIDVVARLELMLSYTGHVIEENLDVTLDWTCQGYDTYRVNFSSPRSGRMFSRTESGGSYFLLPGPYDVTIDGYINGIIVDTIVCEQVVVPEPPLIIDYIKADNDDEIYMDWWGTPGLTYVVQYVTHVFDDGISYPSIDSHGVFERSHYEEVNVKILGYKNGEFMGEGPLKEVPVEWKESMWFDGYDVDVEDVWLEKGRGDAGILCIEIENNGEWQLFPHNATDPYGRLYMEVDWDHLNGDITEWLTGRVLDPGEDYTFEIEVANVYEIEDVDTYFYVERWGDDDRIHKDLNNYPDVE